MRVLMTNAPAGLNYELQLTNQGDLEVQLVTSSGGGGSSMIQQAVNPGGPVAPAASADSTAVHVENTITDVGTALAVLVQANIQAPDDTEQLMIAEVALFMSVDGGVTFPTELTPIGNLARGRWYNKSDIPGLGTFQNILYTVVVPGPVASSDGKLWFRITTTNVRGNGVNLVLGEFDITCVTGSALSA